MSSLNSIMSIALSGLDADTGALAVTSNNIANSDTPGYTREVVNLTASQPVAEGNVQMGTGVTLQGFQSVRDEVLQSQINDQTQQANASLAQSNAMQQVQTTFSGTTTGIGADMTAFFNSISQLSTNPADTSLRQAVLGNATSLVDDFHSSSNAISTLQTGLDETVPKSVNEINQLSTQIATLNQQIASLPASQDPGTLEDQRDQLVSQLSQLTSLQTSNTANGPTITTGNGTPLVIGNQSFALGTTTGSNGLQEVTQNGQDITSTLTGGSLGGTLQARDSQLPALQSQLDDLASQFSSAVNTANQSGYDLTGAAGQAFFSTSGATGAAASIQLALTSTSQIAASSDGTAGSAGNLTNLLAVQSSTLDAYSSIVYTVGNAASQAQTTNTAANAALSQLQTQQASISGVNMDEETTNMIQYQQSYEAAAKVVSTISNLYTTLIDMGTTTA